MYQGTNRAPPPYRRRSDPLSALTRVAVLVLACFPGSDGVSMAGDSELPADARLTQSTKSVAPGGTDKTGGKNRRDTAGAVDQGSTAVSRINGSIGLNKRFNSRISL